MNVLERDGLAKRVIDPADRRKLLIYLTPRGRSTQAKLQPAIRAIHERAFASFSDDEIRTLHAMFARIEEALKTGDYDP